MADYYPPELNKEAFNCPQCGVYAHQAWHTDVAFGNNYTEANWRLKFNSFGIFLDLSVSICSHCSKKVLWYKENMLLPRKMTVPDPPKDIPPKIKEIYNEAGKVLIDSPRASGALMRLALEQLLQNINKNELKLYENVNKLITSNIPEPLIKALSILRVTGNNIMHTGEIEIFENNMDVLYLFDLFNMIVEGLITNQKKLNESYNKIPESIRKQIEKEASKNQK